jgi:transposase-like protein
MAQNSHSKAAAWRRHIREWRRSGLTQERFCRRHGLALSTFSWWQRHLRNGTRAKTRRSRTPSFVPIRLAEPRPQAAGIEVELQIPGGRTLRIRCDRFDQETLRQILGALEVESRSC